MKRSNGIKIVKATFSECKKQKVNKKSSELINILNLVGRGLASNPKMEYQVFLCIFH